ncbi:hypothetical protein ABK040_003577 [Willaertia magna]
MGQVISQYKIHHQHQQHHHHHSPLLLSSASSDSPINNNTHSVIKENKHCNKKTIKENKKIELQQKLIDNLIEQIVKESDLNKIKQLILQNKNIIHKRHSLLDYNLLYYCIYYNKLNIIYYLLLLSNNNNTNIENINLLEYFCIYNNNYKITPLCLASYCNNLKLIKLFLLLNVNKYSYSIFSKFNNHCNHHHDSKSIIYLNAEEIARKLNYNEIVNYLTLFIPKRELKYKLNLLNNEIYQDISIIVSYSDDTYYNN